jgi:hypothetical protein
MTRKSKREIERALDDVEADDRAESQSHAWRQMLRGALTMAEYLEQWGGR